MIAFYSFRGFVRDIWIFHRHRRGLFFTRGFGRSLAAISVFLILAGTMAGCSSLRYYVPPADEGHKEKLALLKVPRLHDLSLDDIQVTHYDEIYLMPGWHSFRFGWLQNKGCKRWKVTKYVVRAGTAGGVPVREDKRCMETKTEVVSFMGWWEFQLGDKLAWEDLVNKLKDSPRHRDRIDVLSEQYRQDDVKVREKAVQQLGFIRNLRAVYLLTEALKDEDSNIQQNACSGLGRLDNNYAVPHLRDLRKRTDSASVRAAVDKALRELTGYP